MKKILLTLLTTSQLFAASAITSSGGYEINRMGAVNRKYSIGTALANGPFGVKAKYKKSLQGGLANSTVVLQDSEGLSVTIPDNAIIRNCMIDVVTQPTSATGDPTVSFSSKAVADLKAAQAISTLTADLAQVCIPVSATAATWIKVASETTLKMLIGSESLTAGEINLWIEYVLSE